MGWLWVSGTIVAALVLFGIRRKWRVWYGLLEIVGAIALMIAASFAPSPLLSSAAGPFEFFGLILSWPTAMAAAIYLFVEGLTNIDEALPLATRRVRWTSAVDYSFARHLPATAPRDAARN